MEVTRSHEGPSGAFLGRGKDGAESRVVGMTRAQESRHRCEASERGVKRMVASLEASAFMCLRCYRSR